MKSNAFAEWFDISFVSLISMQDLPLSIGARVTREDTYGNKWTGSVVKLQKRHNLRDVQYLQFRTFIEFPHGLLKDMVEVFDFIPGYIGGVSSYATEMEIGEADRCPRCGLALGNGFVTELKYEDGQHLFRCDHCMDKHEYPVYFTCTDEQLVAAKRSQGLKYKSDGE